MTRDTKKLYKKGHNSRWARDCDFKHKLSPEELDYYNKFEVEFYDAGSFDIPIHTDEDHIKSNQHRDNASRRDILNISDRVFRNHKMKVIQYSDYSQADYTQRLNHCNDTLVDMYLSNYDEEKRKQNTRIKVRRHRNNKKKEQENDNKIKTES